ncbi:hypothetical protein SEA_BARTHOLOMEWSD_83 [Streptomyces phage BartholomewSD]|uniref:Uncharacterized protein n=1 Tax=Streptomyces phage Alvy TaxID=2599888 RepID=A0A5J6TNU0_9CAUD|nr:hypothetical protein KGG89_gp09 [Streptomyces phage Alvy]QAX95531.1 hypothetical protein SEA_BARTHOLOMEWSD_83 [Streptomyces phage BartholomewSD]QFG12491.1 hypothetical protein SEA_ALVY_85 [Streptomyces phage Alvy]
MTAKELVEAMKSGKTIVGAVTPAVGREMEWSPRRKNDGLPWIEKGQVHDWARYRSREVRVSQ